VAFISSIQILTTTTRKNTSNRSTTMAGNGDRDNNAPGLSRAAKKRARKKQKTSSKDTAGVGVGGGNIVSQAGNPRRPERVWKGIDQHGDDPIVEDFVPGSTADDDDEQEEEEVKMKDAVEMPSAFAQLPKGCQRLYDILLIDNDDQQDDDNSEKASPALNELRSMTSRQRAHCALEFLLQPASISVQHFYETYWEKKPLHIKAKKSTRLDGFLSLESIRELTHETTLYYGKDVNVTRYEKSKEDGVKRRATLDKVSQTETDGPFVAVDAGELWTTHWEGDGCTVRLLCPHQHSPTVHALLSLLELEWGCMVGANAYLTPPKRSQGFAPHYDDIEALCLQLEGRKRWRVYAPLNREEVLPRVSSKDYVESDLKQVQPVLDVVLEQGDFLYMPRGWIHQACTLDDSSSSSEHSLHLTVSTMQQWAWADLMEIVIPEALESAIATSKILREGLPPRFFDYMGAVHDSGEDSMPDPLKKRPGEDETEEEAQVRELCEKKLLQESFRAEGKKRIMRVAKEAIAMLDAACDQMGKRFMSDRLPPALRASEKAGTSLKDVGKVQVMPKHLCRLARPGIARLVLENEMAVLYHCVDNSLVYHGTPLSPMEFEMDDAPAIEQLLTTTEPFWIGVSDLIHDTIEEKVGVVQALYDEGILAIRHLDE
jgi:bifunctional lysine-specific demethylase and histidyl-hydroxylase NO66